MTNSFDLDFFILLLSVFYLLNTVNAKYNMGCEKWYDYFIDTLHARYPNGAQLVKELMDLLCIEREAVYRRLRRDVAFSIFEIAKISSTWDISLDSIINIGSGKVSFQMQSINYVNPSEQELNFLRRVIQSINYLKDFPDTEFMDICNKLPRQLLAGFGYLNRFYLFKWMYQYSNEKKTVLYSQVNISDEMLQLTAEYYRAIKNVPQTNFIFDRMIFDHLVCEIQYFHSIRLITDEERKFIKNDLYALLDYWLEVATHGCYPETQNKVNLYISQLNIDTNYSYTFTNQINICFVHVFDKFEIYTFDPEMVKNFRIWMQFKKRASFQISEVDEKSKMEFFSKQRQLVDTL